jgi:hypothetical protein
MWGSLARAARAAEGSADMIRADLELRVKHAASALAGAAEADRREAVLSAVADDFAAQEYPARYGRHRPVAGAGQDLAALRADLDEARAALEAWDRGLPAWMAERADEARAAKAHAESERDADPRRAAWPVLHAQEWDDEALQWRPRDCWRRDAPLWPLLTEEQQAAMSGAHDADIQGAVCAIDGRSHDRNWRPDHITTAAHRVGLAEFVRRCTT